MVRNRRNLALLIALSLTSLLATGYFLATGEEDIGKKSPPITATTEQTPTEKSPTPSTTDKLTKNETTPTSTPIKSVYYDVPFTSQAPLAEWDDPLQQDGCEEASSLMAASWAKWAGR